jgi:hypothetical protein
VKVRHLLQAVDFGADVAEHDAGLSRYFVETSSFLDVVNDRVDLILGDKGIGKTAIIRHLAEPKEPLEELADTDLVRAFNPEGDIIFRSLRHSGRLDEPALRLVWNAYVASLLGNHLVATYWHETDLGPLRRELKRANLLAASNQAAGVWALMERILSRIEGEAEFAVHATRLPLKPKLGLRWRSAARPNDAATVDLERLLQMERDVLSLLKRRVWLFFDRLDEAFAQDWALESLTLRALMRTAIDVGSQDAMLRVKCLLRSDVVDRIVGNKGFVNATHLRRKLLKWDSEDLVYLVARRIASDADLAQRLSIDTTQLQTREGRLGVCHLVLPARIDEQELFTWIQSRTSDAHGRLNPRNVITLLTLARDVQLSEYDRDDPDYTDRNALIGEEAMQQAAVELSEKRLDDTILAEAPKLQRAVNALRERPARVPRAELAAALHLDPEGEEFADTVKGLVYSGVASTMGDGPLAVALLYRPALRSRLNRRVKSKDMGNAERHFLEQKANEAVKLLRSGVPRALIDELDNAQSGYVVRYVRDRYPDIRADERSSAAPYALRRVEIRAKQGREAGGQDDPLQPAR